jgi:hypothetical protein
MALGQIARLVHVVGARFISNELTGTLSKFKHVRYSTF